MIDFHRGLLCGAVLALFVGYYARNFLGILAMRKLLCPKCGKTGLYWTIIKGIHHPKCGFFIYPKGHEKSGWVNKDE